MKTTFFCKLLNNPFQDPVVFVRLKRDKKAFLFDAGDISPLSMKEVLRISQVFVSHMHIDHFIGFDVLIRCLLSRQTPVSFYGPEGIIHAVESKLKGFTWNLIKEYPLCMEVFEATECAVHQASFYSRNGFARLDRPALPPSSLIYNDGVYSVEARIFDHGIAVLGFALEEEVHININKAALQAKGFPVGPWLNDFKEALRSEDSARHFTINAATYCLDDLRDLAILTKGQKIAYITDISPTKENIDKAIDLASGADTLFIEAFFLEEDHERANRRNHLTTTLAGFIGRAAGVQSLYVIHVSPKYITQEEQVMKEVFDEFRKNA